MTTRSVVRSRLAYGEGKLKRYCVSSSTQVYLGRFWAWCFQQTPPGAKAIPSQLSTWQRGAAGKLPLGSPGIALKATPLGAIVGVHHVDAKP